MLDPEGVNGSMGIESYIGYLADYTVSFAEYFSPSDTTFVLDEPGRIAERLKAVQYEFGESMSHRLEKGDILPKQTDVLYDTSYCTRGHCWHCPFLIRGRKGLISVEDMISVQRE